jgi:predicted DNA-binding transcriptional regulator AlpA
MLAQQIERRSYTISEWCQAHGFSRVFFYKLLKEGDAPLTIGTGKRTRISVQADERWVKRQETKAKRARA